MARKPVPVPRVIPFQPPLPFHPLPVRQSPPDMLPLRLKEAARAPSPSRQDQCARAVLKLCRLIDERPYSGGLVEATIDRLLRGGEAA